MEANWTINLLVGDGDVTFYNKFPLVHVSSTQERYKLNQDDGGIEGQEPSVLYHNPDNAPPIPSRITEMNKRGQWVLSIFDDENATPEWDTILNNVHAINRHMSGADSTAARHTVDGTAQNVRVAIKPQGATNTTYYTVQSGYADVSKSYYTKASQQTTSQPAQRGAWFIPINFVFTEAGYGDSFTIRNDLASSPHMIEDSNSDGLADGLVAVNSPTTTTINLNNYLVGDRSQQITGDALEGFETAAVTATTPSIAAYAWIRPYGGAVQFRIKDTTGNVVTKLLTDGDTGGVSDKTIISLTGTNWYRVSYSGTLTGNNPQIQVLSNVNGGAFLVDALYLQLNTTTIPDGWCSSSSLKNRYDPTSTSAATRQQINYLDVWGIPGDVPAWVRTKLSAIDVTATGPMMVYAAHQNTDVIGVNNHTHVIEGEDITTSATWTTLALAAAHGGSYKRNANTGATDTAVLSLSIAQSLSLFFSLRRMFIRCRSNVTGCTIKIDIRGQASGATILTIPEQTITNSSDWYLLDMGVVNGQGLVNENQFATFDVNFLITTTAPSAANIDIDVIFFMPVDELLIYKQLGDYDAITAYFGGADNVYNDNSDGINRPVLGELYRCPPAEISRYYYLATSKTGEHRIGDLIPKVELTVTPRTSHLLGTA